MRFLLICIFLIWSKTFFALNDSSIFNNLTELKAGIYTLFSEIELNSPKYSDCTFENKEFFLENKPSIYCHDKLGNKNEFEDKILLAVLDGKKYIRFQNHFYKLIVTGAICIFSIETTHVYSGGTQYIDAKLYFLDIKSGLINDLNHINIDETFKQDSNFYLTYSKRSKSDKKKTLYSYVLKYNVRNPIYIKNE